MKWYYSRNGETAGPVEEWQIIQWVQLGGWDAMVQAETGGQWMPVVSSPFAVYIPRSKPPLVNANQLSQLVLFLFASGAVVWGISSFQDFSKEQDKQDKIRQEAEIEEIKKQEAQKKVIAGIIDDLNIRDRKDGSQKWVIVYLSRNKRGNKRIEDNHGKEWSRVAASLKPSETNMAGRYSKGDTITVTCSRSHENGLVLLVNDCTIIPPSF